MPAAPATAISVLVDSNEHYPYRFAHYPATTQRQALCAGDYAIVHHSSTVAAVERETISHLLTSVVGGSLGFALVDISALPHAAVAVEGRYSDVPRDPRLRSASGSTGWPRLRCGIHASPPSTWGAGPLRRTSPTACSSPPSTRRIRWPGSTSRARHPQARSGNV